MIKVVENSVEREERRHKIESTFLSIIICACFVCAWGCLMVRQYMYAEIFITFVVLPALFKRPKHD